MLADFFQYLRGVHGVPDRPFAIEQVDQVDEVILVLDQFLFGGGIQQIDHIDRANRRHVERVVGFVELLIQQDRRRIRHERDHVREGVCCLGRGAC